MKKRIIGALVLGLSMIWAGCWQKSVHPFYLDENVVSEQGLIGMWVEDAKNDSEKPQSWRFQQGHGKSYELEVHDDDVDLEFDARLFELGGNRFLDLYSRKRAISEIPAHNLFRVRRLGEELELQVLSIDWFKKWVEIHPDGIAHVTAPDPDEPENRDRGEIVLTAGTKALQKFVLTHLNDEGFFEDPGVLKRVNGR